MSALSLSFNNLPLSPITHNSQFWLTSIDLARSLGYSQENAITKTFNRHKDEFTDTMSVLVPCQTGSLGESSGLQRDQRIFSLRGCHLVAMFSRTAIAKEFRKWVLDILDNQTQLTYGLKSLPPSPNISESEATQFKKSMEAHCQNNGKKYPILYRKVYEFYEITSYKNIPAGKLEEAAQLCGMKLLKLVKPKMPDAIPLLTLTQDELNAKIAEAARVLAGELMPKEPATNSITITLAPMEPGQVRRWLVSQLATEADMFHPLTPDQHMITLDEAIVRLLQQGYVVVKESDVIGKLLA